MNTLESEFDVAIKEGPFKIILDGDTMYLSPTKKSFTIEEKAFVVKYFQVIQWLCTEYTPRARLQVYLTEIETGN